MLDTGIIKGWLELKNLRMPLGCFCEYRNTGETVLWTLNQGSPTPGTDECAVKNWA